MHPIAFLLRAGTVSSYFHQPWLVLNIIPTVPQFCCWSFPLLLTLCGRLCLWTKRLIWSAQEKDDQTARVVSSCGLFFSPWDLWRRRIYLWRLSSAWRCRWNVSWGSWQLVQSCGPLGPVDYPGDDEWELLPLLIAIGLSNCLSEERERIEKVKICSRQQKQKSKLSLIC